MTTYFVTRHPGAKQWAVARGLVIDCWENHLDPKKVSVGDTVIGVLPVSIAAAVCARGAKFIELVLNLPEALRGREVTETQMCDLGAVLKEYTVTQVAESITAAEEEPALDSCGVPNDLSFPVPSAPVRKVRTATQRIDDLCMVSD